MRFYTLLTVLFFTLFSYSQDKKGYYIDNAGNRIDGYFKASDFSDAENLEFRNTPEGNYKHLMSLEIKEYGIGDQLKFVKQKVKIDVSRSSSSRYYSKNKEPQLEEKNIFLNVIVEGEATLYSYLLNDESKFFYNVKSKDSKIHHLVHKKYESGNGTILVNNAYMQELSYNVKCAGDTKDFSSLSYTENSLKTVFKAYNECLNSTQIVYENKEKIKGEFKYVVFAGASNNFFAMDVEGGQDNDTSLGINLGGEVSYITPYSYFAFFVRADYSTVDVKTRAVTDYSDRVYYEGTYNGGAISLTLGSRFYFAKKVTPQGLFADAGIGVSMFTGKVQQNSYTTVNFQPMPASQMALDSATDIFFNVGLGYTINSKFGVDLRYETPRGMADFSSFKYSKLALNFRYTLN